MEENLYEFILKRRAQVFTANKNLCPPISHLPSSISHLPSPISHLPSPVSCLLSSISRLPSPVSHPVAIALITLPFLLGLGSSNPLALQLSVGTGIAALILTLLTDHQLGLVPVIPYRIHLMVDFLVGVVFIIAPFIFSFEGLDAYYYWLNGAAVLSVVSMHKAEVTV